MEDYGKIVKEKGLPAVGQTVRSKKYGTHGGSWRNGRSGITSIPTQKPENPA